MKDNLETYKIWAPDDAVWTAWAKPVLFMDAPGSIDIDFAIPDWNWITHADYNTMLILDLPGKEGVEEGLALARLGYRPVPLYNGVLGPIPSMVTRADKIAKALQLASRELSTLTLRKEAPPVFLLDSNRMRPSGTMPGKFDNRWCVFPQDMPSAAFLAENRIHKIILHAASLQNDLSHILRRYQEKGIKIYQYTGKGPIKEIEVVKPSRFKSLLYRFSVILGLRRNAAGGFGGKIPEPTQSSSGGRYYGMG